MLTARVLKPYVVAAVAVVAAALVWQFSKIVHQVDASTGAGVPQARLAAVRAGVSVDRVQALLGPPELTSDVYRGPHHLVQCWYYGLGARSHTEVCFDHWRVFHKERYS
jgi:outer membrane protein assembly factor BamE (lipoprotein component of BamABCDE complex)